jgi:hypothetical protein
MNSRYLQRNIYSFIYSSIHLHFSHVSLCNALSTGKGTVATLEIQSSLLRHVGLSVWLFVSLSLSLCPFVRMEERRSHWTDFNYI